ncbi:MAG: beta-mannosidase, partial [Actinobacteria bacterium]|nr:beta-mannosidase [Actinomycetota bacterium]
GSALDRNGKIWSHHNNTFEKQTVSAGIRKHYKDLEKLGIDQYILYASLCQGIMLQYSLESIRFTDNCWGSLFWMYNDCWGEVGWSIIDYYLKRKPSYYFVKRAFAPLNLILREKDGIIKVLGVNDTGKNESINIEYGYVSFDGKEKIFDSISIELIAYTKDIVFEFRKGKHNFLKGACFVKPVTNRVNILPKVLRTGDFKDLEIPEAEIKITNFTNTGNNITFVISSNVFVHAVHFDLDEGVLLSDDYFDLLPEEKRTIVVYNTVGNIKEGDIKPVSVKND